MRQPLIPEIFLFITGSEYDENGNIRQWWTNKSHTNFVKRSKCLIDEYNNVTIFGYKVRKNSFC